MAAGRVGPACAGVKMAMRWREADAGWMLKGACLPRAGDGGVFRSSDNARSWRSDPRCSWLVFVRAGDCNRHTFPSASDRRFRVTPLDILVIFIALAVPNLPGSVVVLGDAWAKASRNWWC